MNLNRMQMWLQMENLFTHRSTIEELISYLELRNLIEANVHDPVVYRTRERKSFTSWKNAQLIETRKRINIGLIELRRGGGVKKHLGGGLIELKLAGRPPLRIYYASTDQQDKLVLIFGGFKNTQNQDIEKARKLLKDFHAERRGRKKGKLNEKKFQYFKSNSSHEFFDIDVENEFVKVDELLKFLDRCVVESYVEFNQQLN